MLRGNNRLSLLRTRKIIGNNRLSLLRTRKIIERVCEIFSIWLFQFKFVYFTHFLLSVLESINLVVYRLRDNLFN